MGATDVVLYRARQDGAILLALVLRKIESGDAAEAETLVDLAYVEPAQVSKYAAGDGQVKTALRVRRAADQGGATGYANVAAMGTDQRFFLMTAAEHEEYQGRRDELNKRLDAAIGVGAGVSQAPQTVPGAPAPMDPSAGVARLPSAADLDAMAAEKLAAEQTSQPSGQAQEPAEAQEDPEGELQTGQRVDLVGFAAS